MAEKEGINEFFDGEPLFKWKPGSPILSEHAVEEVTPPLEDVSMKSRGNVGHDISTFNNGDPAESNNPEDIYSEDGLDEEQEEDDESEDEGPVDEAEESSVGEDDGVITSVGEDYGAVTSVG